MRWQEWDHENCCIIFITYMFVSMLGQNLLQIACYLLSSPAILMSTMAWISFCGKTHLTGGQQTRLGFHRSAYLRDSSLVEWCWTRNWQHLTEASSTPGYDFCHTPIILSKAKSVTSHPSHSQQSPSLCNLSWPDRPINYHFSSSPYHFINFRKN